MRRYFSLENVLLSVLLLVVVNLIILDINVFQNTKQENVVSPVTQTSDCPNCQAKISNLENQVNQLLQQSGVKVTPIPTPTPEVIIKYQTANQADNSPREYYVPFGSGSGNYSDWTDIPGLQAYIDSNAYGAIKSIVFEASLHVPNGNETASVRLINATDGRVVSGSQLDFNGNTSSEFLSSPILLDYGKKLYKVQLKTQLSYPAVLDQSRVHITTK